MLYDHYNYLCWADRQEGKKHFFLVGHRSFKTVTIKV